MTTAREVQLRIKSVKNISQVTSALAAVSASKASRAQRQVEATRDYASKAFEILKQLQFQPIPIENQVILLFAGTTGYADKIPLERMADWKSELIRYFETSHPDIGKEIAKEKRVTDTIETWLRETIEEFNNTFV